MWSRGETTELKHGDIAGGGGGAGEAAKDTISKPVQKVGDQFFQEQPEYEREGQQGGGETKSRTGEEEGQQAGGGGGGVLHAIGETIVEIGQTTKEVIVGLGQSRTQTKGGSTEHNK